jgi:hypothetical protein
MNTKSGLQITNSKVINFDRISSFELEGANGISIIVGSSCHTITSGQATCGFDMDSVSEAELNRIKSELEDHFKVRLSA